jgi:hypothetical protein
MYFKCVFHLTFGPLLEDELGKMCTRLWQEICWQKRAVRNSAGFTRGFQVQNGVDLMMVRPCYAELQALRAGKPW